MNDCCLTHVYAGAQKMAAVAVREHLMEIVRKTRLALDEAGKDSPAVGAVSRNPEDSFDEFLAESPTKRKCRIERRKIYLEALIAEAEGVIKLCYEAGTIPE